MESRKQKIPLWIIIFTYFSYLLYIAIGHLRDFLTKKSIRNLSIAPLLDDFESFYTRNIYARVKDCWNRPITGFPSTRINILDRDFVNRKFSLNGKLKLGVMNLGSYNYLGFGNESEQFRHEIETSIHIGISSCLSECDGKHILKTSLEKTIADYVGQESCVVISMGFATNSTCIPALVSKVIIHII